MAKASMASGITRIQKEKRAKIFDAALQVFSEHGLRGATLEQIAAAAGMSKSNIVYYFDGKEAIYRELLESLLDIWLAPMRAIRPEGDPMEEILGYVRRKLEMSAEMPRESRLFATEILQNAPRTRETLSGDLKDLVDQVAAIIRDWASADKIAPVDPYHLIFSIWAMTQHYADFDMQVQAVLGPKRSATRFEDAETYLTDLFRRTLAP